MATKYLTTAQAAALIGWPQNTLRKACREKRVPHWRIGGRFRFDQHELEAWIERGRVTLADVDGR